MFVRSEPVRWLQGVAHYFRESSINLVVPKAGKAKNGKMYYRDATEYEMIFVSCLYLRLTIKKQYWRCCFDNRSCLKNDSLMILLY